MKRLINFFKKHIPSVYLRYFSQFLTLLCGIFISMPTDINIINFSFRLPWEGPRFLISAFLFIFTSLLIWVSINIDNTNEKDLKEARNLIEKYDKNWKIDKEFYVQSIENRLESILGSLKIHDNETRITVYQHDPSEKNFIPIKRCSLSPKYSTRGRKKYNDSQGVISRAWNTGESFFKYDLEINDREWDEYNYQYFNIDTETSQKITMKSKLIFGLRLSHEKTKHVGVLIIESVKSDKFSSDIVDKLKGKKEVKEISLLLKVTNNRMFTM